MKFALPEKKQKETDVILQYTKQEQPPRTGLMSCHCSLIEKVIDCAGQFPWLVTLELNNTQRSWHKCDGVLLTKQWVLTAAHCVDNEKPEYLQVVSGEHRRDLNEGTEQKHKVNNILKYPQFIQ
ncbi:Elastase-1 [Portunus trituberculatus]|uniref:Elastase-1 n=1 Tax=Portunus trituberculatus TaxID=210409 RepID=A0A5B7JM86_PORTR|nr:Elastase-1 [Portunus trituberculatus]